MSGPYHSGRRRSSAADLPAESPMCRGWLEKFALGRGIFSIKNWKKRYFVAAPQGVSYYKTPDTTEKPLGSVWFTRQTPQGVHMNPVFLLPVVTLDLHPQASDPTKSYFGIEFRENSKPYLLLLRAPTQDERNEWVRYLRQFIHCASNSSNHLIKGRIDSVEHPLQSQDPDSPVSNSLRNAVVAWDEGVFQRAQEECPHPIGEEEEAKSEQGDDTLSDFMSVSVVAGRLDARKLPSKVMPEGLQQPASNQASGTFPQENSSEGVLHDPEDRSHSLSSPEQNNSAAATNSLEGSGVPAAPNRPRHEMIVYEQSVEDEEGYDERRGEMPYPPSPNYSPKERKL